MPCDAEKFVWFLQQEPDKCEKDAGVIRPLNLAGLVDMASGKVGRPMPPDAWAGSPVAGPEPAIAQADRA